jgi:hypothetical protein
MKITKTKVNTDYHGVICLAYLSRLQRFFVLLAVTTVLLFVGGTVPVFSQSEPVWTETQVTTQAPSNVFDSIFQLFKTSILDPLRKITQPYVAIPRDNSECEQKCQSDLRVRLESASTADVERFNTCMLRCREETLRKLEVCDGNPSDPQCSQFTSSPEEETENTQDHTPAVPAPPPDQQQHETSPDFPYLAYGLNYTIPLRDPNVQVRSDTQAVVKRYPYMKIEYWDTIVNFARSRGYNPALWVAIWIEETAGSTTTLKQWGGAGRGTSLSHMGCAPNRGKFLLDPSIPENENVGARSDELHCFLGVISQTQTFAEFMARYSSGPPPNPFSNNKFFVGSVLAAYRFVTEGAGNNGLVFAPTITPTAIPNPVATVSQQPPSSGLTYYNQCDPSFQHPSFGTCTSESGKVLGRLCFAGCGPTTVAQIVASYANRSYTPVTVASEYKNNGWWTCNGSNLGSHGQYIERNFSSSIVTRPAATLSGNLDQDAQNLKPFLDAGWTAIARATYTPFGGHFVWVTSIDASNDIWALDPYWAQQKFMGPGKNPPINLTGLVRGSYPYKNVSAIDITHYILVRPKK